MEWNSGCTVGYSSGWGRHHTHNNETNEINMLANFEVSVMVIDRVSSLVETAVGLRFLSTLDPCHDGKLHEVTLSARTIVCVLTRRIA